MLEEDLQAIGKMMKKQEEEQERVQQCLKEMINWMNNLFLTDS